MGTMMHTPDTMEPGTELTVQSGSALPRLSDGASALEALASSSTPVTPMVGTMAVEQQRAIAEVQAAMVVAKQFPRDIGDVVKRIKQTCSRKSIAEVAAYSYKRGSEEITGPTVYLLKAIAQEFGNISFGVRVLSTTPAFMGKPGESTVEAFAWDMERNVRETRNFTVKHWRDTRAGGYAIKEERDIYELIANMGSRRVRACLEGVIPADIQEFAVHVCNKALLEGNVDTPEFRAELLSGFAEYRITKAMIETRLNKKFEAASPAQLLKLQRGLVAIRDGVTTPEEAFPELAAKPAAEEADAKAPANGTAGLKERLRKPAAEPTREREPGED